MQHLLKISYIRNRLYSRAVEQFLVEQDARGVQLRNPDVPERLCAVRTILVDSALVMQGNNAVRCIAAPLEPCDVSSLKRQRAWMVLTAGISLSCESDRQLQALVEDMNFTRERMLRQYPQVASIPYDAKRRMETTVHRDANGLRAYAKGDVKSVLRHCTHVLDGRERLMEKKDRTKVLALAAQMEKEGLRTIAFATRWREEEGDFEQAMVYLGTVSTGDLPRPETPERMQALRRLGVRPILTAAQNLTPGVVKNAGVLRPQAGWLEAKAFDNLTDYELRGACAHADAYLGMNWKRKERLAQVLRQEGPVATLVRHPRGGMVLAMGKGSTPDAVFASGDIRAVVNLLGECRALRAAYTAK